MKEKPDTGTTSNEDEKKVPAARPGVVSVASAAPQGKPQRGSVTLNQQAMSAVAAEQQPQARAAVRPGVVSVASAAPKGKRQMRAMSRAAAASTPPPRAASAPTPVPSSSRVGAVSVDSAAPQGKRQMGGISSDMAERARARAASDAAAYKPGVVSVASPAPQGKRQTSGISQNDLRSTLKTPSGTSKMMAEEPTTEEPGVCGPQLDEPAGVAGDAIPANPTKVRKARAARSHRRRGVLSSGSRSPQRSDGNRSPQQSDGNRSPQRSDGNRSPQPSGPGAEEKEGAPTLSRKEIFTLTEDQKSKPGASRATATSDTITKMEQKLMQMESHQGNGTTAPTSAFKDSTSAILDLEKKKSLEPLSKKKSLEPPPNFGVHEEGLVSAVIVNEEDLEAEFQEKMLSNAVAAEAVSEDELNRQSRCRYILCCCCLVIVLAVVIPLSLRAKDPLTYPPTAAPTEMEDYDYLSNLFYPISGDILYNETSPQNMALNWLTYDDPAMLPIKTTNETTLISRYVLAVFYYSTGGPSWKNQLRFLSNYSHCDWKKEGESTGLSSKVKCNIDRESVRVLQVDSNNLNGTIPREIGALVNLEVISLTQDPLLHGTIPTELGSLTSLGQLQLAINSLSGPIPNELGYPRQSLSWLILYSNELTGTIPASVMSDDARMEFLLISNNMLTGTLPDLKDQSKLKWLWLDDNMLEGPLPRTLYKQSVVEQVTLSNNLFNGTLADKVGELGEIRTLKLNNNQMSGIISTTIGKLDRLQTLRLDGNGFSGQIPTEIGNMMKITTMDLSWNSLTGAIPDDVAWLRKLSNLNLAHNQLTGSVPSSLARLGDLKQMYIQNTSLTDGLSNTFCSQTEFITPSISADCGGDPPKIECDCCTTCCNDGEDCQTELPAVCEIFGEGYESPPERGALCICSEEGATLSCEDTTCQSCFHDDSFCVVNKNYGHTFDEVTGKATSFRNEMHYSKGPWTDVVTFSKNFSLFDVCDAYVNGEKCDICNAFGCSNGFDGILVDCSNLEGGYKFDSCKYEQELEGYLDAFKLINPIEVKGCEPYFIWE